jgi:hypothetical protein
MVSFFWKSQTFGESPKTFDSRNVFLRFLKSIGWYELCYGFLVDLNLFQQNISKKLTKKRATSKKFKIRTHFLQYIHRWMQFSSCLEKMYISLKNMLQRENKQQKIGSKRHKMRRAGSRKYHTVINV